MSFFEPLSKTRVERPQKNRSGTRPISPGRGHCATIGLIRKMKVFDLTLGARAAG